MPPHNHVYKPPHVVPPPPPPPPPTQQQRSRGGSIGKQNGGIHNHQPQQQQNLEQVKPAVHSQDHQTHQPPIARPLPQPDHHKEASNNKKALQHSAQQQCTPTVHQHQLNSNSPSIKSPPPPPPPTRKLAISTPLTSKVSSPIITSLPRMLLSPATSAPSTPVGSPALKRVPPPLPPRSGVSTPTREVHTSKGNTANNNGNDNSSNAHMPTPPPPPAVAVRSINTNRPLPSPIIIACSPLAASPMVLSPALTASPAIAQSPLCSPGVMSPNILSPQLPRSQQNRLNLKASLGITRAGLNSSDNNGNYDSGNEDFSDKIKKTRELLAGLKIATAATPGTPPTTNLKSSVGIMRDKVENSDNNVSSDNSSNAFNRKAHLLRSPMVKDYFANIGSLSTQSSPVTRRAVTQRRSVTPPGTRRTDDSPTRTRKLSEPVPIKYNHLMRRAELLGSHDGISMPYNITHTTHINGKNFELLVKDDNHLALMKSNIPLYDKSGYLHKLAGASYKERWFECKQSVLTYYKKKGDTKPRNKIFLYDCEFDRDKSGKQRPHTLHLTHTPTKKQYYISAVSEELMEEWVRALQGSGAIDKDFVVHEQETKERERKEYEARVAREFRKRENDYVREKFKKRSSLKLSNKNMTDGAIRECKCEMIVTEAQMKEGRIVFRVDITFDDQQWTIFRKYDKVVVLYNVVYKLKFVKGLCPPKKAPSSMPEADFTKLQITKLQEMLNALIKYRSCVLASASAKQAYLRFIAPVGWDDIKPTTFIMPFTFDF